MKPPDLSYQINPPNPSGLCMCGCGRPTKIAHRNNIKDGWVKGHPTKYIRHHQHIDRSIQPNNLDGLCQCGCGERTPIAPCTNRRTGMKKGFPLRFVNNHRKRRDTPINFGIVDMGYKTACWIYSGSLNDSGYAMMTFNKTYSKRVHRVVYEMVHGSIPEGLGLDHLCRNRACIRPDHLEPTTSRENTRRGATTRLKVNDVLELRQLRNDGWTFKSLSKKFGISAWHASMIYQKRKWADV
jgi:hypothetical protein